MRRILLAASLLLLGTGCATYNYAQNVKTIGFTDDLTKGKSVGNIRGEDCTWHIAGYPLGGAPTVDRAFMHARNGTDGSSLSGSVSSSRSNGNDLRYINNVNTQPDGFDAVIFGKRCIVVTGVGYK